VLYRKNIVSGFILIVFDFINDEVESGRMVSGIWKPVYIEII